MSEQNALYPIFLKIEQLKTLIVGGGEVALEKLTFLLKSSPGAAVTVVSPHFNPNVKTLAAEYPGVRLIERTFITDDLIGKNLAIICTDNEQLNFLIKADAHKVRMNHLAADRVMLDLPNHRGPRELGLVRHLKLNDRMFALLAVKQRVQASRIQHAVQIFHVVVQVVVVLLRPL